MTYTVYFRDSEECLRCLSHSAACESEAIEWFVRVGITVVAIRAEVTNERSRTNVAR